MPGFDITCAYCPPPNSIMAFTPAEGFSEEEFGRAWKARVVNYPNIECAECGAQFKAEDDGTPASEGGSIQGTNVSRPKIASVDIDVGTAQGGTRVTITGKALDVGTLAIKFGGEEGLAVNQVNATTAEVTTPPGVYRLKLGDAGTFVKMTSGGTGSGTFQVGEVVSAPGGKTGTIRHISDTILVVESVGPDFEVGDHITGASSGADWDIVAYSIPTFLAGETIQGLSSMAQATMRDIVPLIVKAPTGAFGPNEYVLGQASFAMVKLAIIKPYSGIVDIELSNEYGTRRDGSSTLQSGYTYA